jgi:hypothetical protein
LALDRFESRLQAALKRGLKTISLPVKKPLEKHRLKMQK